MDGSTANDAGGAADPPDPREAAAPQFEHAARLYSGLAALIGVLGAAGWWWALPALSSIVPGLAPMKLGTSIGLVLSGITLILLCGEPVSRVRRICAALPAFLILGWGGLVVCYHLMHWDVPASGPLRALILAEPFPGMASTATGLSFLLLGLGFADLCRMASGIRYAQPIAVIGLLISVLALTTYVYDVRALYSVGAYDSMPLGGAVAFVLLFASMLICRPRAAWISIFAGDSPANLLARRVLPWALALPFVSGWVVLVCVGSGLVPLSFGITASTVFSALLISGIVWRTAYNANVSEAAREGAARALRRSDHLRSAVFEAVLDPLITLDRNGWIIEANMAARRALGMRGRGGGIEAFFAPGSPPPLSFPRSWDERVALDQRTETTWRRADGSVFPAEISVSQTWPDGRQTLVLHIRDLTVQKATETQLRQAQKMEAVGQLTGGLAHDFNNLLAIILGNLDLMADRLKDEQFQEEFVQPAVAAAERGSQLTQRLLAFGRRQSLQPELTDINALIEGMVEMLRRALGPGVEVRTALAAHLRRTRIDPAQLENALLNLGINARDAMDGKGRLTIGTHDLIVEDDGASLSSELEPGAYIAIAVADSGSGMPPEIAARVFEPFFTTKEVGKGTGLGLSMVYGFIKQSGGHIGLDSAPGRGTTVTLYLPGVEAELENDRPLRAGEPATAIPLSAGETVLIVEDDADLLAMAVGMLRDLGYRVRTAATGRQAIMVLEGEVGIDLLFTDLALPGGMNGIELARAARRLRPGLKILCTSGYAEAMLSEQPEPDMPLLRKPFRRAELALSLRRALHGTEDTGRDHPAHADPR